MKINLMTLVLLLTVVVGSCSGTSDRNATTNANATAAAAAPAPQAAEGKQRPDTLTIAMSGDMMLGTLFPKPALAPDSGKHVFDDAAPILQAADLACGNLEGALANSGKSRKNPNAKNTYAFLMPTYYGKAVANAGYDFVSIANNHVNDFYDAGIQSTIKTLDEVGVGRAGSTHCDRDIKTIGGVTYGFCAFSNEPATMQLKDTAIVRSIIADLRQKCDVVIVSFHGGAEGASARHLPHGTEYFLGQYRGDLRSFAHFCIDCGADVVYGHGPHVARAIELYKDHFIAYSLGNFATPYGMGLAGPTGYAPLMTIRIDGKGRFIDGKIHSMLQTRGVGPRLDKTHSAAREIRSLTEADIPGGRLAIADDGTVTRR